MKRGFRTGIALVGVLVAALALTGCNGLTGSARDERELVLYSGRREHQIEPAVQAFQARTGIRVVIKAAGAAELANLILEERRNPRADVYLSNDAGALERLRLEGAFEPYETPLLEHVPDELRAPDHTWTAATIRARVIMYNRDLVGEADLPRDTFDLADPKWKGQVGMASGANESVIANVTALTLIHGAERTERFLRDLMANEVKIYKGHGDVRQAVGRGEVQLGWVNHYYYYQQLQESAYNHVGIVYPDQESGGTTVNVSGLGIVNGARHAAEARAFIDFLLSPEGQEIFAGHNFEFPVRDDVEARTTLPLAEIERNPVRLSEFGEHWDRSVQLIDRLGLVLR